MKQSENVKPIDTLYHDTGLVEGKRSGGIKKASTLDHSRGDTPTVRVHNAAIASAKSWFDKNTRVFEGATL